MNLEQWIDRATQGLAEESSARVREEIGEHYRAALAEPGATEESAVRSLGDAAEANRQYCRVLLTAKDTLLLQIVTNTAPAWRKRLGTALAILLVAEAVGGLALTGGLRPLLPTLLALAVWGLVTQRLAPHLPLNTPARGRWFRWSRATVAAAIWWLGPGPVWAPALLFLLALYWELKSNWIRRKIPRERWPAKLLYF